MKDFITFMMMIGVVLMILNLITLAKADTNLIEYLANHLGAAKGVYVVLLTFILIVMVASKCSAQEYKYEPRYLYTSYVYLGLDYTWKPSVFCDEDGAADNITSNLGAVLGLVRVNRVDLEARYTHHSCVLNGDRKGYDAFGGNVIFRFW